MTGVAQAQRRYADYTMNDLCRELLDFVNCSWLDGVRELLQAFPGLPDWEHPDISLQFGTRTSRVTMFDLITQPCTLSGCQGLLQLLLSVLHHRQWNAVSITGYTLLHALHSAGDSTLANTLQRSGVLQIQASTSFYLDEDDETPVFPLPSDSAFFGNAVTLMVPPQDRTPVDVDHVLLRFEQMLVEYDVSPGQCARMCTPDGRTLLHWAAEFNNLPIAKFLLQNGAKVNAEVGGDHSNRRKPIDFCTGVVVLRELERWP